MSDRDEDAVGAVHATFVAESRYWAGTDNSWSSAARGRSFADAALASSRLVLDKVSVTTQTITLSGTSGKIPLSIKNGSGKTLSVYVVASARNARFPGGGRVKVSLRPADNYVTVPIDLAAGSLSEQVRRLGRVRRGVAGGDDGGRPRVVPRPAGARGARHPRPPGAPVLHPA